MCFHTQATKNRVTLLFEHNGLTDGLKRTFINGDRVRLEQVLRNFLSNALKFTPAGGTITVRASVLGGRSEEQVDDVVRLDDDCRGKWQLQIEVQDTGVGLAAENLPKVFKDIIQFNANKLQKGGGSGFGLWSK